MSNANHLCRILLTLLGPNAELIEAQERPWASATFSGARHIITLRMRLDSADASAPSALLALPDHEFLLPGEIVADCAVTMQRRERSGDGGHGLCSVVELLTIAMD
ncbi:MAG: hypothetical protein AABZ45_08450 [Pseudomonadota bacterium]